MHRENQGLRRDTDRVNASRESIGVQTDGQSEGPVLREDPGQESSSRNVEVQTMWFTPNPPDRRPPPPPQRYVRATQTEPMQEVFQQTAESVQQELAQRTELQRILLEQQRILDVLAQRGQLSTYEQYALAYGDVSWGGEEPAPPPPPPPNQPPLLPVELTLLESVPQALKLVNSTPVPAL